MLGLEYWQSWSKRFTANWSSLLIMKRPPTNNKQMEDPRKRRRKDMGRNEWRSARSSMSFTRILTDIDERQQAEKGGTTGGKL